MSFLWQKLFILQARSGLLKRFAQNNRGLAGIASRFVGGPDAASALDTAASLRERGIRASLFNLGEYVTDREAVARTVEGIEQIIGGLESKGLDVHVSIDPSQIGYSIDPKLGEENALRIGSRYLAAQRGGRSYLMLDMEDAWLTEPTLALRRLLHTKGVPAAITLQACLRRTESDLIELLRQKVPSIRLVKGAFAESRRRAWTRRSEIDESYLRLAALMMSAQGRESGFHPVFATHDENLIRSIVKIAGERGYEPGQYEFEMLYGVREGLQRRLVAEGRQLRLYVPFGQDWWPYTARRIGESPRNAALVLRALAGRNETQRPSLSS